mmetsp:Transcript_17342/g.43163  ORF Transcript_17342/g.43163 Transcript_17342/m.43163 type:complete len:278 (+) Transcript_17342:624-1457(+)
MHVGPGRCGGAIPQEDVVPRVARRPVGQGFQGYLPHSDVGGRRRSSIIAPRTGQRTRRRLAAALRALQSECVRDFSLPVEVRHFQVRRQQPVSHDVLEKLTPQLTEKLLVAQNAFILHLRQFLRLKHQLAVSAPRLLRPQPRRVGRHGVGGNCAWGCIWGRGGTRRRCSSSCAAARTRRERSITAGSFRNGLHHRFLYRGLQVFLLQAQSFHARRNFRSQHTDVRLGSLAAFWRSKQPRLHRGVFVFFFFFASTRQQSPHPGRHASAGRPAPGGTVG